MYACERHGNTTFSHSMRHRGRDKSLSKLPTSQRVLIRIKFIFLPKTCAIKNKFFEMEELYLMDFDIEMCNLEGDFAPLNRSRSNTWPLPEPEGYIDGPLIDGPKMTGNKESIKIDPPAQQNPPSQAAGVASIKKKSSRRNAWGSLSYAELITQAISSSKDQRLTLSEIYDWMVQNVPYFRNKGNTNSSAGWKNSIRHNLSLHNRFIRASNDAVGKSSWWMINPDAKVEKSTRRRAATVEGGKYEGKRTQARKRAAMLRKAIPRKEVTSSPSSSASEGYDFSGSPHYATKNFHSPAYRPRLSSCASSCGKLSPIPAVPCQSELPSGHTRNPQQFTNQVIESVNLTAQYKVNEFLKFNNQQTNKLPMHYQNNNDAYKENNFQNISTMHAIQFCPLHRTQMCNCMSNWNQTINTSTTYNQTQAYHLLKNQNSNYIMQQTVTNHYNIASVEPTLMPIQEANEVNYNNLQMSNRIEEQTTDTLCRNNSLLDDIDEIIKREQFAELDTVNNTLTSTLHISNNNSLSAGNQNSWINY